MPLTSAAVDIVSISIIGVPFLFGTCAQWYLNAGSLQGGHWAFVIVLLASSLLNIMYLLSIPAKAFFGAPARGVDDSKVREAPWPMVAAMVVTAGGCVALFFFPEPLYMLAQLVAEGGKA